MKDRDTSYALQYSAHLMKQHINYLDDVAKREGIEMSRTVAIHFLASFIGVLLHRSLTQKDAYLKEKKEIFEYTEKNFKETKARVQEAVAAGFTGAMNAFAGKDLDYYCKVTAIGPPINKKPC